MASREKRPLAPSKSKSKVNNDCTLPTIDQKNRKGKGQTNTRQQQIAQDILDAVATGSQLPVKINASLPRKKAIKNLRRKPKLKATKSNLIKVKITKKAPIRALRKTNAETIRAVRGRRPKKNPEEDKTIETDIENPELDNSVNRTGAKGTSGNTVKSVHTALNTLKHSLKSKQIKYPIRSAEVDNCITEIPGKETDATNSTVIISRNSPKAGRKVKITYKKPQNLDNEDTEDNTSLETEAKFNKLCKVGAIGKRSIKEKDNSPKTVESELKDIAGASKNLRLKRNTSKERDIQNNTRSGNLIDIKNIKAISDNKNLVDLTIDEVIACKVLDPTGEELQGSAKRFRKGRKVSERLLSESEIKREPDIDELKTPLHEISRESDQELPKASFLFKDMNQSSPDTSKNTLPRTRYNRTLPQRSLRNGKLRRSSELGIKFETEDQTGSDSCAGDSSMDVLEVDTFFYESNLESSRENMNSAKGEISTPTNEKGLMKHFEDDENSGIEIGNNNNGERGDRSVEVGPMLRSKTKAKTTDPTVSVDGKPTTDLKNEEMKIIAKDAGTQDDSKKGTGLEHMRKENILANISDKPKSRRSSLNVEMKKTVGSFYGADKSDNPKSQIDQMIENIKLNIAKSIESKIFGPEKSLVLNKNFEMSKMEEIVAPLSTESQKKSLDEEEDDTNTPNISKNEINSENSENSVPKVADTAKEIEKMVMGDMEIADTQSEKRQKSGSDNGNVASVSNLIEVSKNLCQDLVGSAKEELQAGNCSSHVESIKNDEKNNKPTSEELPLIIAKSVECDKNTLKAASDEGKRQSSIAVDKIVQNKNAVSPDNSSSSVKDTSQCTINYETFKLQLKDGTDVSSNNSNSNVTEAATTATTAEGTMKLTKIEDELIEISEDLGSLVGYAANVKKNETCLNATIQSEESETLESISREVERLVAESESAITKPAISIEQPTDEMIRNDASCLPIVSADVGENSKLGLENPNKNATCEDFIDIVDSEVETNRFLDALESSFTDSDILSMAPEISEVLAQKELSHTDAVYSKETIDSKKLTQKSVDNVGDSKGDEIIFDHDAAHNYQLSLNGQDNILSSQNLSLTSKVSDEEAEKSSEISSQSVSHFVHKNKAMESNNLSVEKSSNSEDFGAVRQGALMSQENIEKDPEVSKEIDKSNENNRSSTVSGETSEKRMNDHQKSSLVANENLKSDVSNGEGTMKRDSQLESTETHIISEEQTSLNEENKRVLRARDRQKKVESGRKSQETVQNADINEKTHLIKQVDLQRIDNGQESKLSNQNNSNRSSSTDEIEKIAIKQEPIERGAASGPLIRTRRSREVKKRKDEQQQVQNVAKTKRSKRDNRKSDQQNKEETLLDNEVAKINENTQSLAEKYQKTFKSGGNFRGFSEGGSKNIFGSNKVRKNDNDRSHSETDLESVKFEMENVVLYKKQSDNLTVLSDQIQSESRDSVTSDNGKKIIDHTSKTPETLHKDLDETSTSSESSGSAAVTPKILETPEDKAKKESILRLLGLESLEKAAERMNHQKAKKEQYTGTLKTVIRVQKEKDKKRSRSPLKMVLKQGRSDGDGDSPEFYTIQKELGTSGLGDSSSGANRKFSTNHRHSCDEDPEESPSKDRQSLVIPEKSSSFSIHPGRLCADVCCYCFGKFGSLDTPMHLATMKSDERRKKILNVERHLTKDSCLCDACYRHVDRKANTSPTNMQSKPQRQHRQLMVSKCTARECREPARHHVKRRWLLKIKAGLQNQVDIDWESSQHTSMSFCVNHYSKIERFLTCALCKRRLARTHTHQLVAAETEELNERLRQQGIPVPLSVGTFVCKLCRYFTQLQLKYKDIENMNANHKSFFKSYRKRILHYHDIEILENEEEDSSSQNQPAKDKDKRKKSKCGQGKSGSSKSLDSAQNSTSEKSTPEPNKNEGINFETDNDSFGNRNLTIGKNLNQDRPDIQILNVEDSIENLKKRKSVDLQAFSSSTNISSENTNDLVEILAMDKEVTLTRLPKRARTNSDITPVVQRLGANPSISVRTLFPGEEEMNLHANVEFNNVREVTPQGWEKCATMIQYDRDTKLLWQELQRPYGNQSSFLRHLILLEKYYRSGDLVLAPNASRNAINYSTSVQNRLISYEGPEKVDEPILEPISSEFANPRRLSGGFMMERDRLSIPSTSSYPTLSTMNSINQSSHSNSSKRSPPHILKLNTGVSIIKKPPPNLHRLNLPSTSTGTTNNAKRKDNRLPVTSGGKVFQLSEPEYKKLQNLKRQKQMLSEKPMPPNVNMATTSSGSVSPSNLHNRPATQYQKAQIAAQTQFQKHLRMQQEMLSRQSRSDFEPLICDVRSLSNENSPTQNLINNLNLPKSIQVTTKPPNTIPIMPKIPKSLTVIPQTITRPIEK